MDSVKVKQDKAKKIRAKQTYADVAEVLAIHERLMDEYYEAFKKLAQ